MKAVCISNFNYYTRRIQYMITFLEKKNYDVSYITGDYDTMNRQMYTLEKPNVIQIPLIQYQKNISFERIFSHYQFAKNVYQQLVSIQPDIIYAMLPPNYVGHFIAKYKKEHPHVKVIFDVFDMWPETFPSTSGKTLLAIPFMFWKNLRMSACQQADLVMTECQMFSNYLKTLNNQLVVQSVYPCQPKLESPVLYTGHDNVIPLCYLGSINNIIDIDLIEKTIQKITVYKPVILHIIGNGEKQQEFLNRMRKCCQDVLYHGNVYDDEEKQVIFNQCAFGINMLKSSVFIGLTLKTIDYFNGGLPILNTVDGDTKELIDTYQVGINVQDMSTDITSQLKNLTRRDILENKHNAKRVFSKFFNETDYLEKLQKIADKVGI